MLCYNIINENIIRPIPVIDNLIIHEVENNFFFGKN